MKMFTKINKNKLNKQIQIMIKPLNRVSALYKSNLFYLSFTYRTVTHYFVNTRVGGTVAYLRIFHGWGPANFSNTFKGGRFRYRIY